MFMKGRGIIEKKKETIPKKSGLTLGQLNFSVTLG